MRCGSWMIKAVVGGFVAMTAGGCMVPLDKYRDSQASRRQVIAQKEQLSQELFDERALVDSFRTRVDSLEGELSAKDELLANLRREAELLDEMRKTAQGSLEQLAARNTLGDITISGPKLPQQLDSALRQFASEHPSEVEYDAARGTVKWKSDLLFALGSDVVKNSSKNSLSRFTEIIQSTVAANFEVIVVGHTDNVPIVQPATRSKHPTNWHLSAHRAIAVGTILANNGYAADRVGVMGFGEFRPVADNNTEEGKGQNRRVEVYLIPRGTIVASSGTDGPAVARLGK